MFLCVFSLSSCFSLVKKILAFFASLFSKQKLCRKNFMFFCLSVPFSFRVFLSSVFHVVFLFDFSRSSSQHASLPLYFLLLFILFPSDLSFLSPLVFSFLSPSFSLFKLPFLGLLDIFMFLEVKLFVQQKKYLSWLLPRSPFQSSIFHQKKLRFLCFLFCCAFSKIM